MSSGDAEFSFASITQSSSGTAASRPVEIYDFSDKNASLPQRFVQGLRFGDRMILNAVVVAMENNACVVSSQAVFQITPLNVEEWIAVLKLSFPVIIIDEVLKLIARKFTDGRLLLIHDSSLPIVEISL